MARNWQDLIKEQRSIIEQGISSGNALICGYGKEIFLENYVGYPCATEDSENSVKTNPDTIFHLYSMTKLFTVTAALLLWERGMLDIDAPVSLYLEEYKNAAVYENGNIVPVNKTMTVRTLFTMTSGLSYFAEDPSGEAEKLAGRWRSNLKQGRHWDTVKFAREIAAVPLEFQPGDGFRYGLSHDVLGAIIELVSGITLDRFFEENILKPLGMNHTFFRQKLPPELESRLAKNTDFVNGKFQNIPLPQKPVPSFAGIEDPAMFSGGSGLVGTAKDYARFLMSFTERDNSLLKPETLTFMTSPQLTPVQREYYNAPGSDNSIFGPEHTFALGVRVQDREAPSGAIGEWGWSGALGTWFFLSPKDNAWFVYMHQHTPACHGSYVAGLRNTFYRILKTGE